MVINLNIRNAIARSAVLLVTVVVVYALVQVVIHDFFVFSVSYNPTIDTPLFKYAVGYIPGSPRLLAGLAASETRGVSPDLESAEKNALEAIKLSPNVSNYRLLLARIRNDLGDTDGAEQALRDALALAPNNYVIHWRLANLMVRQGKIDGAIEHFRFAANYNPVTVPVSLDLVWQLSGENAAYLHQIVRDSPQAQIKLALFFANKGLTSEAIDIFGKVDQETMVTSPDTALLIYALSEKGSPKLAREIWLRVRNSQNTSPDQANIWNGSFETERSENYQQFEWLIEKSGYAKISIDNGVGHTGTHSLLIDFLGRDTTKLDNEIRQVIVLRPGAVCQLDFFVKTEKFYSPVPGVVATVSLGDKTGARIAESKPIPLGDSRWQQMSVNFTVPKSTLDGVPLVVSIKRLPRYEYDEPTRGKIWFDDFTAREVGGK